MLTFVLWVLHTASRLSELLWCSAVNSMASEDRNHLPVEGTPQTSTVDRETMKQAMKEILKEMPAFKRWFWDAGCQLSAVSRG